jgi:rare lipoprotein A
MRKTAILLSLCFLVFACAKKPMKPADVSQRWSEKGTASWYGNEFKGKPTANGEPFDPEALTAAHKTLPLGTVVSVTNVYNDKKVELRINDRGPFVHGRILDCSKKGARELGFLGQGTAQVKIEIVKVGKGRTGKSPTQVIDGDDKTLDGSFTVQAGAFKEKENAEKFKDTLNKKFGDCYVVKFQDYYRVRVGHFKDENDARQILDKLSKSGIEGFLTRND